MVATIEALCIAITILCHCFFQSNHTVMVEWIPTYVHREDVLNHLQLSCCRPMCTCTLTPLLWMPYIMCLSEICTCITVQCTSCSQMYCVSVYMYIYMYIIMYILHYVCVIGSGQGLVELLSLRNPNTVLIYMYMYPCLRYT